MIFHREVIIERYRKETAWQHNGLKKKRFHETLKIAFFCYAFENKTLHLNVNDNKLSR